jgi:kynurenine formamidase
VTHVDALCHMFVRGRMYNGFGPEDVRSDGAVRNSVYSLRDGVVGRGVLLDVAAYRGEPFLDNDSVVRVEDLEGAERAQAVEVGPGDVLIVGCGRDARREANGGWLDPGSGMAGLHPDCLPFLHEREISMLASDGISDAVPGLAVPNWPFPIHQIGITGIGLHLIDNMALAELSAACAARRRWDFLFMLAPLRIEKGTGCPVNPVAVL